MKNRKRNIDTNIIPIVSDGAIGVPDVGDGRIIPVIVIDCRDRDDILDLIYAHEHSPPGDVKITWGKKSFQQHSVYLLLEFERPSQVMILLQFKLEEQGMLVDGIFRSKGLYLQPLESGARVTDGLDNAKILIEVPDTNFFDDWNGLFKKHLLKNFKKKGLSTKEAHGAVENYLKTTREMWDFHKRLAERE